MRLGGRYRNAKSTEEYNLQLGIKRASAIIGAYYLLLDAVFVYIVVGDRREE